MKSVNRVTLLGNVTRDPELKSTTGGQTVATFGLATNRVWRGSEGEKKSLRQYRRKGKPLFVEGYLKTRSWDSGEGTKIFRTEIVVENIILLGPKSDLEGDPVASGDVPQGSDASAPSEDVPES
ncbi:MAG: Single-stranded DNA-binding protein [Candidatus Peribacteria bacterium GW2011_GWB1_54_5]|nr:MAG: Single-stranded DNA-binding protein [Candidatus Peribacteria bacterium GW2011_GWB1_54_5]